MKKRILTILLAGLLSVSATSCMINPSQNPGTSGTGTTTTTTGNQDPGTSPDQFREVNETVYAVVDNLNLRISADTQPSTIAKQVAFKTELQRVGVNNTWSKVKCAGDDTVYFVSTAYLTTDDIAVKHFTAHAEKTMYATEAVKVRHYPTTHEELSKKEHILKTLQKNESVLVVGTGNGWYQVKFAGDDKFYYVSSDYLSTTQVSTQDGLGDYIKAFKDGAYTQPQQMYIATDSANVRKYPSADNSFSSIVDTYVKGTAVTVVAQATINSRLWAQISVPDATDPAAPPAMYYISLDCLSATQGGASLDLAQTLAIYTNFKTYSNPTTKTMYVANTVETSLVIRTSPSIPEGNDAYTNCIDSTLWPKAKAELTVVAYGTATHAGWYIINYQNGFYFVSAIYLTPNSNGTPVLTLEAVLATYKTLEVCTETEMKILKPTNYYSAPTMQNDVKLGTFTADQRVTVIAKGTVENYEIYVIKGTDGNCWFITSDAQSVAPVQAS